MQVRLDTGEIVTTEAGKNRVGVRALRHGSSPFGQEHDSLLSQPSAPGFAANDKSTLRQNTDKDKRLSVVYASVRRSEPANGPAQSRFCPDRLDWAWRTRAPIGDCHARWRAWLAGRGRVPHRAYGGSGD